MSWVLAAIVFAQDRAVSIPRVKEGSIRVMEEFDLDIFTRMRGKTWKDFQPRFRYLAVEDARIPYLHPADLIFLKQGSWREKDKLDVLAMQELLDRESAHEDPA